MSLAPAGLEAFVAVARRGNVTAAARDLYVTQPALTARLQRLEQEVGAQLFVRGARGVSLTEFGAALLPHAERALEATESGRLAVSELRDGSGGRLALATAPAVGTYVLPSVLRQLLDRHPRIALSVRTGHSEEILELVQSGEVELGIGRAIQDASIESTPLFEDELVLVVPPQHRFAADRFVSISALSDVDLILFDRESTYHGETSGLIRSSGVTPRSVLEVDNIAAAKRMVAFDLGVAFLPRSALDSDFDGGHLVEVFLSDTPVLRRAIVAIRRRDGGPPTAAAATLLGLLRGLPLPPPGDYEARTPA